jgi:phage terminase Nu1 subunit (DNA packaging protein)
MEYKEDATKMQIPKKNIKDLMEFKINIAKEWLSTPINNKRPNEDENSIDANEEPPNKV